jgi:hypothetical protein
MNIQNLESVKGSNLFGGMLQSRINNPVSITVPLVRWKELCYNHRVITEKGKQSPFSQRPLSAAGIIAVLGTIAQPVCFHSRAQTSTVLGKGKTVFCSVQMK